MSIYKSILVDFLDLNKWEDLLTIVSVLFVQYGKFLIAALSDSL
jgi:hypothetical protein